MDTQHLVKGPVCQSCGRPLTSAEDFGTNADNTRVNDYCAQCYQAGAFTEPGISVSRMTERTADHLAMHYGVDKEQARAAVGELLPRLRRWGGSLGVARRWWTLTVRGGLAVVVGTLLLVWPGRSLMALVLLFGLFALLNGVFSLVAAFFARGPRLWWVLGLEGLVSLAVGLVTLVYPGLTAVSLYAVIAAWAILIGALEIVAAIRLRDEIQGELWLVLSGALSIGFGVLLYALPLAGILTLAWVIGIYTILFGALLITLSLRLRELGQVLGGRKRTTQPA